MSAAGQGQSSGGGSNRGRALGNATPSYDHRITVFSSNGRLYQVEYAMNAVRLPGVTSVGVRGADSVCVVGQRSARATKDKLLDTASVSRLFPITERLGLLATGIAGDGRTLAHEAKNQTAQFRFKWGYEMPPDVLAQWIADRAQICTQFVSKRPSGVVAMILGIDDEKETPQLFTCDPAGYFLGHKAASAGHKDREAVNFLEKKMKNNPSLSFPETIQMAISALQFALKEDLKATEIEVGVVRKDDPIFRLLTAAEIDEHLKAINPGKQS
ncbi:Proteasome subunit alpha type-6 [Dichanthelium oligosanthes]|uniref:Proteasome subunit alpha type n=1 Tax=Dichanthelium oligosanthes TaxID=888268 RepID=A0A1E5V9R4_9POAL|nr:Proteasome subunit alpha type-6 [Dichanthelium oligosanthes]